MISVNNKSLSKEQPDVYEKYFQSAFRDATSAYFGGVRGVSVVCPSKILSVKYIFFFVTVVHQMVLDAVSCPAEVHGTPVFVLRNDNFQGWGVAHPHTPLSFVPVCIKSYPINLLASSPSSSLVSLSHFPHFLKMNIGQLKPFHSLKVKHEN